MTLSQWHRLQSLAGAWCLLAAFGLGMAASAQPAQPPSSATQKAADPAAIAAARELLAASGVAAQFDAVIPTMLRHMADVFVRQQPAHEKTIREAFDKAGVKMSDRKGELIAQIARLYAERFSVEELKELAQFYSTGVGRKFIDSQVQMATESMQLGQRWGERIGREIEREMRDELRRKGIPI